MAGGKKKKAKSVETLTHGEAARRNIPTAEFHSVIADEDKAPIRVAYERRNRDLDPQLVWRGKDEQDAADLVVQAPPLYIQEKVHPKVLIDDLLRRTKERRARMRRRLPRPTSSPISTACPTARRRPSSTATTPTGRTA